MEPKKKEKTKGKITNEKPVSLSGLNFKEALAALLKVIPPKQENTKKNKPSK